MQFLFYEVFGLLFCGLDMKTYRKYRCFLFFLSSCLEESFCAEVHANQKAKFKKWLEKVTCFFYLHYKF